MILIRITVNLFYFCINVILATVTGVTLNDLKAKSQNLLKEFKNYVIEFKGLSLNDL